MKHEMTEKYDENKGIALYIDGKLVIGIHPNNIKGEAGHTTKDGINIKLFWRNLND